MGRSQSGDAFTSCARNATIPSMPPNAPRIALALALFVLSLAGPSRADWKRDALLMIKGTVVTMDDDHKVIPGSVLIRNGKVEAILPAIAPAPPGALVIDTKGGFIFPGLMNLHNHI